MRATLQHTNMGNKMMVSLKIFSEVTSALRDDLSLGTLLEQHRKLNKLREFDEQTRKLFAEVCFLTAREYLRLSNRDKAKQFANQSIQLYNGIDTNSLERALPILSHALPDFMHEGVVKAVILSEVE